MWSSWMEALGGAGAGGKPLGFNQLQRKGFKVLLNSGAAWRHCASCDRAETPARFQGSHLETRVNRRLLLV